MLGKIQNGFSFTFLIKGILTFSKLLDRSVFGNVVNFAVSLVVDEYGAEVCPFIFNKVMHNTNAVAIVFIRNEVNFFNRLKGIYYY